MPRTPNKKAAGKAPLVAVPARQKKVSNPASTGGRGESFERRVQAVRLLAMCLGSPCAGIRENYLIASLLFQGRVLDHNTDDLVVFTQRQSTGQSARLNLQMKRSLRATGNPTFLEAVGLAWLDFRRAEFNRGLDENLIVFDVSSHAAMKGAVEVVKFAKSSLSAATWYTKVHAEGFGNTSTRNAYAAIAQAAEEYNRAPVEAEELREFAVHLSFMAHDLDSDQTTEVAIQKQLIKSAMPWLEPSAVWARLMAACAELNGLAGEIEFATARLHLSDLVEDFRLGRLFHESLVAAQRGVVINDSDAHPHLKPLIDTLVPLLADRVGLSSVTAMSPDLPASNVNSVDSVYSRQLDRVKQLHNDRRYREALSQLETLQDDLTYFDDHQRARWHFLRGMCYWHLSDDHAAASDLEVASQLYLNDDKIAAGLVRAHLLRERVQDAIDVGQGLLKRFPESFAVWQILTNARVINHERLSQADIPVAFQDKSSAWQMLASSYAMAEESENAIRAIETALLQSDASVFILENYLRLVLRLATENPFHVESRWQPQDRRDLLLDAISRFDDREKVLWAEQSLRVQTDVVFHLAYSYLLLADPENALSVIEQGRARGVPPHEATTRVELEALNDLGRHEEGTQRFEAHVDTLPIDSLVAFGQACLAAKREDLLLKAMSRVSNRDETLTSKDKEVILQVDSVLHYLHWELLLRLGQEVRVREELSSLGITPLRGTISQLVFAARAYAGDPETSKQYEHRVMELAETCSTPQELAIASQLMLSTRRYKPAADILERLLSSDVFTPLHVDLIYCYAALDERAKLRDLLHSLPLEWRQSSDALSAALHLYGNAGDWPRMLEIAQQQVSDQPDSARAWLMLVQVSANISSGCLDDNVSRLPDLLEGTTSDGLKLGSIEITTGATSRGLRRIYRAMRCCLNDLEAAALHLTLMITLADAADEARDIPEQVAPGTSVELQDANGTLGHVTIDLETLNFFPSVGEFIAPDSPRAAALIGLEVGDHVSFPGVMGEQTLKVIRIISVHHRLVELSNQCISSSVIQSETLTSLPISHDENGSIDLSGFVAQLEHRKAHGMQMLGMYAEHAATLGLIARMIGADLIDLIRGWPIDGPLLETTFERGVPTYTIDPIYQRPAWVVDLSLLVELAILEVLDVLEHLPKVYVSSATRIALAVKLDKTSRYHGGGTMVSHDGKISIQEQSRENWNQERNFLHSIELAIDTYCEIVPAYGPLDSTRVPKLQDILADEEYATLLVCLEYDAGLLSLDGRLRLLAHGLEIPTASPQMLLIHSLRTGWLRQAEYSCAIMKMMIQRRNFVGIEANDLVTMMDQGPTFASVGLNSLRSYLSLPILAFATAIPVVTDFICHMYVSGRCDVGVMLQLIDYTFEGMFRHPDCPADWDVNGFQFLLIKLSKSNVGGMVHDAIRIKIALAKQRAGRSLKEISFSGRVQYGRRLPVYTTPEPSAIAAELYENADIAPLSASSGEETKANPTVD
ncbi:transcription elongation GreA/GreB family factor [Pseudomonas brassicacearum]|uniref:Transcription elongation GreA/GreB family factor n=1 Tax=Pseudomonas brassicacearum TaxID=930166 RepID=A0AAW8MB02_9PSED|nr:hypothetical protein [Pseudomonas brassicacearum]MDR6958427.1 transcription elongation GreA/GreB family factor [Pseudomonas brassicacearum]